MKATISDITTPDEHRELYKLLQLAMKEGGTVLCSSLKSRVRNIELIEGEVFLSCTDDSKTVTANNTIHIHF